MWGSKWCHPSPPLPYHLQRAQEAEQTWPIYIRWAKVSKSGSHAAAGQGRVFQTLVLFLAHNFHRSKEFIFQSLSGASSPLPGIMEIARNLYQTNRSKLTARGIKSELSCESLNLGQILICLDNLRTEKDKYSWFGCCHVAPQFVSSCKSILAGNPGCCETGIGWMW